MRLFTHQTELWLPRPRAEVFPFFADATNLELLTPAWLRFAVLTPAPIVLRAGARIDYRLRVHGVPLRWQSEITAWEPPHRFIDEQRRGPFRRWVHEHRFEEQGPGTRCLDRVSYAVPGGRLVAWLFVRRDVERIFAFRQRVLQAAFPPSPSPTPSPSAPSPPRAPA